MTTVRKFFRKGKGALAVFLLATVAVSTGCGGKGASSPGTATPVVDTVPRTTENSGGATTVLIASSQAFENPAPNLSAANTNRHLDGDVAFGDTFVTAPAQVNPGLGPVFNSNACEGCHVKNGRGRQPEGAEDMRTMLVRLSIPGTDANGGPSPAPGFGGQLQVKANFGVQPEASVQVSHQLVAGVYGDGTAYELEHPTFTLTNPYIPLPAGLMTSPRVAPQVMGLGLLEAIPEATIMGYADENDADGDGISGRPNMVWDAVNNQVALGRFGWKANQPHLLQQAAAAYRNDMGITNPIFNTDPAAGQAQDDGLQDDPEITAETLELAAFYVQTLAVPARRNIQNVTVRRGEELFHDALCAKCHIPTIQTGTHFTPTLVQGSANEIPALSNQQIHAFTDLLLHDMGPDLADNRPDFLATGQEWRTPPLWGIGLFLVVNGHDRFLHDGRARNLEEAILWHGGEGEASREAFKAMGKADRDALVAFLRSL